MNKLNMHTPNLADENFRKLAALFPNAVTETMNEDGEVVRAIDKDVLMQEINTRVVEGREERYQFTWPDKKKAVLTANAPISATLRPVRADSVGRDGTPGGWDSENLYIEGDNLDVLKLLRETYLGKVKMIYIDPPYNTGNDFVYEDDFAEDTDSYMARSGQYDDQGNQLVQNTDSNGRFHTDWLNMIYPRLRVAKDLLSEDGVIFISIDDNESANLVKICSDVFGERCFVADIAWQRTYAPRNDSKGISNEKEHIVVFSRQPNWVPNKLPRTEEMNAKYGNPDNDILAWRTDNAFAPGAASHQGMVYAVQHPFTGKMIYPGNGRCWTFGQEQTLEIMNGWCKYELKDLHDYHERAIVCGVPESEVRKDVKGIVLSDTFEVAREEALRVYKRGQWPKYFFTKSGIGGIAKKTYLDDKNGKVVTNLWTHSEAGNTDEAKKELMSLFDGVAPFDTPKPSKFIERIITIATDKNDTILDFFSGSGTTGHAVMKKNASDEGRRKYICVQINEKCNSNEFADIFQIGRERIRRAGRKIKDEAGLTAQNLDIGFRVLRLDSSNMQDVYYNPSSMTQSLLDITTDNIKPDRTPEDLLFQVMLELGVLPSSPIAETTIDGKRVFDVADGFLLACFDAGVSTETVTAIAKRQPYYAVFRDSSMADDSVATNFDQIFETYSPSTVRKVL